MEVCIGNNSLSRTTVPQACIVPGTEKLRAGQALHERIWRGKFLLSVAAGCSRGRRGFRSSGKKSGYPRTCRFLGCRRAIQLSPSWNTPCRVQCGLDDYRADDFEILQPIGRLAVQEIVRGATSEENQYTTPSFINVYAARFATGRPFGFRDERVLLKEYTPAARELAMAEMRVYQRLQNAQLNISAMDELPVPALVGRFVAGGLDETWNDDPATSRQRPEDEGTSGRGESWGADLLNQLRRGGGSLGLYVTEDGRLTEDPKASSMSLEAAERSGARLWLVFGWEGLCTLEDFRQLEQQPSMFNVFQRENIQERRAKFVKAVIRSAIEAVAFCHVRGVVHGALGGSSFLLTSTDTRDFRSVKAKLTNFGFAADLSTGIESLSPDKVQSCRALGADTPMAIAAMCRQHDLRMLGLALAEFTFSALGNDEEPEAGRTSTASLQRLWEGVFELDMEAIRSFYVEDEIWRDVVSFLDEDDRAGWELLMAMLDWHGVEADRLLATSRFLMSSEKQKR